MARWGLGCKMNEEHALLLASVIPCLPGLTSLHVERTWIGTEGRWHLVVVVVLTCGGCVVVWE